VTLTGPSFADGAPQRTATPRARQKPPASSRPKTMAYYFPQWHVEPRNVDRFGSSWTEWDVLRTAKPRFAGHRQPRVPLWGEVDESEPANADHAVRVAQAFGVDGFIVDWYWYDDAPFLNGYLDKGLLGGTAVESFTFALMWANHDWADLYPARSPELEPIFRAPSGRDETLHAFEHVIERYFGHPSYWKIDGRPYFSIYDIPTFVLGLGGVDAARAVLDEFRQMASRHGLDGIHLNAVLTPLIEDQAGVVDALGLDSATHYTWWHYLGAAASFPTTPYEVAHQATDRRAQQSTKELDVPFLPNVTVGWDPTPRTVPYALDRDEGYPFTTVIDPITPEAYGHALEEALALAATSGAPAVTVNAWNEWTEGSYLEPDEEYGYAFLEATRRATQNVRQARA
jgi:hypothetical protein